MKDARSLVGCATFPSSATPVHPSSPVGPARGLEKSPCPNRNRSRPTFSGPPAKRSPVTRTRVHSAASSLPVRVDRSTRPCEVGLPSRRPYGRDIAKRCRHRSRCGRRASAFHALAGESKRLCFRPEPPRPDERSDPGGSVGRTAEKVSLFVGAGSTAAPLTVSTV